MGVALMCRLPDSGAVAGRARIGRRDRRRRLKEARAANGPGDRSSVENAVGSMWRCPCSAPARARESPRSREGGLRAGTTCECARIPVRALAGGTHEPGGVAHGLAKPRPSPLPSPARRRPS